MRSACLSISRLKAFRLGVEPLIGEAVLLQAAASALDSRTDSPFGSVDSLDPLSDRKRLLMHALLVTSELALRALQARGELPQLVRVVDRLGAVSWLSNPAQEPQHNRTV